MADKVTWHGTWAPWYCPVLCLVTQSRPKLFDPVDCSPPGSSVHGDSLARILEVGSHDLLHGPWYYSAVKKKKKEWNNIICSNLDGPRDYNTKWSKSERERQMPYDFTYIWNLKYDTNELACETETGSQIENRHVVNREEMWGSDGLGARD